MSIIGNPIMAGASGVAASIFVTGLSETDTVTATNGSKTLTGKWTQKPNPAAHGLPDGYTELEYIESTGTQYIDTEVAAAASLRFEADFTPHNDIAIPGFGSVFGARSSSYQYILNTYPNTSGGSFSCQTAGASTQANPELTKDTRCQVSFMGTTFTSAKGATTKITSVSNVGLSLSLFARNMNGTRDEYGKVTMFGMKLYENSQIVRDFIPAKRNSDSVIGLYDIVNGVFYENAGTGTFVAGAEVPQTIDGFLIKPIRDFGTWTVTATNGDKTATQDVLVDVIMEYEIEMEFKPNYLMLYDFGDECENVTGGWTTSGYSGGTEDGHTWGIIAAIKNTDNILTAVSGSANMNISALGTNLGIDTTGYNGIFLFAKNVGTDGGYPTFEALIGGKSSVYGPSVPYFRRMFNDTGTQWMYTNTVANYQYLWPQKKWIDTSDFSGNIIYPIVFAGYASSRKANWHAVFMTKADDIATLCEKAGISTPSLLTSFVADATAMNAIFANKEAVSYMAKHCTGDFMALAIQSSAFITAYNASPYKSIVTSNKHWKKFIAMVQ